MINFCHISPVNNLNLVKGRNVHLVLAHLIEEIPEYREFYLNESKNGSKIIVDNSGFEMYKRGLPMMKPERVMNAAENVNAHYVVLSDYPAEHQDKTIESAIKQIPELKDRGFKSFFVPQSEIGDVEGYLSACKWGFQNCDLTGISILGAPNAFGNIEKSNKLQRFLSRFKIMKLLVDRDYIERLNCIHFLGMLDGPNEIQLVKQYEHYIYSWDSSAAIWAGVNGIKFDQSPTGLIDGKFEKEVDFNNLVEHIDGVEKSKYNMEYIDELCR